MLKPSGAAANRRASRVVNSVALASGSGFAAVVFVQLLILVATTWDLMSIFLSGGLLFSLPMLSLIRFRKPSQIVWS